MAAYVNAATFYKNASWHGIENVTGGIFDDPITLEEALHRIDGDYEVAKSPAGATMPDGTFVEDGSRFFISRPPWQYAENPDEWERLMIAGPRYTPMQNRQLIDHLSPLEGDFNVHGMGILKNGEVFFVLLGMPDFTVGGFDDELHKSYLFVADQKNAYGGGIIFGPTNTRVVCWNTLNLARQDESVLTIPHYEGVEDELALRTHLVELANRQRQEQIATYNRLFTQKVTNEDVDTLLEELFALPKPTRKMKLLRQAEAQGVEPRKMEKFANKAEGDIAAWERTLDRNLRRRDEVRTNFERFNDEYPYAADTKYALLNAVTEFTTHSDSFNGSGAKRFVGQFFGQQASIDRQAWEILNAA